MRAVSIRFAVCLTMIGLTWGGMNAIAGEVFQWKDDKGVTHYSQTPPSGVAYQQRAITSEGQAQSSAPAAATKTAAANPQCERARKNLETLQSKNSVQMDNDGDGKPDKTLDDAERSNYLSLAQATIKATCTDTASAAKP